jgi:hypothetical protein
MRKSKRQSRKSYVIVGNDGDPCPRCARPTEIRAHAAITETHLRQPSYYSRWFYCIDPTCQAKQIMPSRYRLWNDPGPSPWDV